MCLTPISVKNKSGRYVPAPCGRCAECLEKFRQDWFIRLREHKKKYNETIFVTFTYNDESIVYGEGMEGSLYPRHMQLFFKSFRKELGNIRISYYLVGEYGSNSLRPHYHAIIFGIGRDFKEQIEKHWRYGIVHVDTVTDAVINYVCKYHLLRGQNPVGCYPSFSRMSKGIGQNYIDNMSDWHNDEVLERAFYWLNGFKKPLPRYFKNKIFNEKDKKRIEVLTQERYEEKMMLESKNENKVNYFINLKSRIDGKNRKFRYKSKKGGKI